MNEKLFFTGGEPDITNTNLNRNAEANRRAMFRMIQRYDDHVMFGASVSYSPTTSCSCSEGYIYLNGEILRVENQVVTYSGGVGADLWEWQKQVTDSENKTFADTVSHDVYRENRGVLVQVASITGFAAVQAASSSITSQVTRYTRTALKSFVLEIGTWNMQSSDTTTVSTTSVPNLGIGLEIKSVDVMIFSDLSLNPKPLNGYFSSGIGGGVESASSTSITLRRASGGEFDSSSYAGTAKSRGFVTIWYHD